MKKVTILSILSIFINFVICSNAFAYIDPGTGSILLQALLGALAAAGAAISIYWSKFKSFFKKKPKDDQKDSNN